MSDMKDNIQDSQPPLRYLIVNADDFGASRGVNRGIIEAHCRGIVTSASLMVTGQALAEAVALSRAHADLAVGLHFDVNGEDEREFDLSDLRATHDELFRQIDAFVTVMGRMPTHIDSHRHIHLDDPGLFSYFREWVEPLGVPLRGDGQVNFVGGFYGQWEWKVTELKYISVPFLQNMLRHEAPEGVTEFSCHPGYRSEDYHCVYLAEREIELATLTDPRIRQTIQEERIHLISYADYALLKHGAQPMQRRDL
ncbi:MAG: ChbG/HpnK family deacetylase [Acidobacteria bacterium]|nr:ChbG/HpnK family deacetylase [Acidobacteriota bacterium]